MTDPTPEATVDAEAVVALVLAAGAGSRFGGAKMQAAVAGEILPVHVVAAARAAGIRRIVTVLGRDAAAVRAAIEDPHGGPSGGPDCGADAKPLVVINPAPERGLSSSLRIGMAAATAAPLPAGVLVMLGDQPGVQSDVIRALLSARLTAPADAIAIVPRYADDPAPNPVLVLRAGFALVADAQGDRGLGPVLAAAVSAAADPSPGAGRVIRVPVLGANPDIDTRADLAAFRSTP